MAPGAIDEARGPSAAFLSPGMEEVVDHRLHKEEEDERDKDQVCHPYLLHIILSFIATAGHPLLISIGGIL